MNPKTVQNRRSNPPILKEDDDFERADPYDQPIIEKTLSFERIEIDGQFKTVKVNRNSRGDRNDLAI